MSIYRVFHAGEWRPVTHLFRGQTQVYHPEQAAAAVLYIEEADEYIPLAVGPGEIFTEWEPILPPESAWEKVP